MSALNLWLAQSRLLNELLTLERWRAFLHEGCNTLAVVVGLSGCALEIPFKVDLLFESVACTGVERRLD
jgi:hypothetical protein